MRLRKRTEVQSVLLLVKVRLSLVQERLDALAIILREGEGWRLYAQAAIFHLQYQHPPLAANIRKDEEGASAWNIFQSLAAGTMSERRQKKAISVVPSGGGGGENSSARVNSRICSDGSVTSRA